MIVRAHRTGFSLINLLIVCSLVVVLTTLSISHISFMRRYTLRLELEKMYALFFYLQHVAVARNQQQTLVFDTAKNTYRADQRQEHLPSGIKFGFLPHTSGPPSKPKKQITSPITFVDNTAEFYPDGTFSAGTIYMVDDERKAFYALTSAVSPVCFIRKYRYAQGSWKKIP